MVIEEPYLHPGVQMSPLGDRLLVKPREAEQVSAGGILLAGSNKQAMADALVGEVCAEDHRRGIAYHGIGWGVC